MSVSSVEVRDLHWRKARRSVGNGACVEVVPAGDHVLVRDSQDQDGVLIRYSQRAWLSFVAEARTGRFSCDRS
jgi:hypothetical protein